MFSAEDEKLVEDNFASLLSLCDSQNIYKYQGDRERIIEAYQFAYKAHLGVRRKSGEPYIVHPIAVAFIVVDEIGMGVKSVIASLLHDVVEDTDYTVEDIKELFGEKIAKMVDGLTKMKIASDFTDKKDIEISDQAENFKKMLLTLSSDVRVIIIKLADRLHNMRTLGAMSHTKQLKILSETMYLFAPLAHRLGLYKIKSELEDLSLKYSFPDDYNAINDALIETDSLRSLYIDKLIEPIAEKLNEAGIDHEITGRIKSVYSIWKKMQSKQISMDEVYDLFAIRIVFKPVDYIPEKTQCWHIYSIVTDIYKPRPDRLREWINIPKANGYEALHCTVMGPEGRWAEVQIRSQRMDDIAEKGFAAHWKYKDKVEKEGELDKWIKEVRIALNSPTNDAVEFLDEFQLNLYASEIVLFTPKGETRTLPAGATALDFAYDIHTKIGNSAIGAKINHKVDSLYKKLESGDQVEIITSRSGKPRQEWLENVKSAKAKACIKSFLKRENDLLVAKGEESFSKEIEQLGLEIESLDFDTILSHYNCKTKDEFFAKIAENEQILGELKSLLKSSGASKLVRYWTLKFNNTFKFLGSSSSAKREEEGEAYQIAECCYPVPGDDVVGLKEGSTVVVHKKECEQFIKQAAQFPSKIVSTSWSTEKKSSYLGCICVKGVDRMGILLDLTLLLTKQMNINIVKLEMGSHESAFSGYLTLYIKDGYDINHIIHKVGAIKGIDEVLRVNPDYSEYQI